VKWALDHYERDCIVCYFNDTKWEHPDLYRFLSDLESLFNIKITRDSDGRSVEDLVYEHRMLPNNRVPFCSQTLKAERLQKFYRDGDILIFGIDAAETVRAQRLVSRYQLLAAKLRKMPKLVFPFLEMGQEIDIRAYFESEGVRQPVLYDYGFKHNNCSGGCVRAGKRQWALLYRMLPDVFADRERVEREFREWSGKDSHILKDETLGHLRERITSNPLLYIPKKKHDKQLECIGICEGMN